LGAGVPGELDFGVGLGGGGLVVGGLVGGGLGGGGLVGGGLVVGGLVVGGLVVGGLVVGELVVGGLVVVAGLVVGGLVVAAGLSVGAGVGLGVSAGRAWELVTRSDTTVVAATGRLAQALAAARRWLPCASAKATPVRPPETTKTPVTTPKVAVWTRREIIDTPLPG
jgi:hypothetical protein